MYKERLEDAPLKQKSVESRYTHGIGPSKVQRISDSSSFQQCSSPLRVHLYRTCIRFILEQDFILRSHFDFPLSSIEELFQASCELFAARCLILAHFSPPYRATSGGNSSDVLVQIKFTQVSGLLRDRERVTFIKAPFRRD